MKDVEALIAKLERPGASAEEIAAAAILRSRADEITKLRAEILRARSNGSVPEAFWLKTEQ